MSAPALDLYSVASWSFALLAALGGSLHCVSMCGPLRLLATQGPYPRWQYQAGRLFSYLTLGLGAGYLGASLPIELVLAFSALVLLTYLPGFPKLTAWNRIRARWLSAASGQPFWLGLASGLLPCGMLHIWVAGAATSASAAHGAILLAILWAGTLPALELGTKLLQPVLNPLRQRFPRALPLALILLALAPLWLRSQAGGGHSPGVAAETPAGHCH